MGRRLLQNGWKFGLLLSILALLASCGTHTSQPAKDRSQSASAVADTRSPLALLAQARKSQSPERENLTLQAAELYVRKGQFARARNLLVDLDPDALTDPLYIKHASLLAEVALEDGSYFLAHGILTANRLENQWQQLSPEMEIRLRELRSRTRLLLGDTRGSVEERVALSSLVTETSAEQNNQESIWQTLMGLSLPELQELSLTAPTDTLRGWYSLALLGKQNQTDLERQQAQLDAWRNNWPHHPANRALPNDLRILKELIENQPRQIALLLPQQGRLAKAGEAVRDGFFAAYYHQLHEHNRAPLIRQYDSEGDIIAAYQLAVSEGADLVIGPLDKDKVNELAMLPSLPVPLLTLNYADVQLPSPLPGLYQFGLAAEDEARQAARQAFREGHRYALLITSAQDWSDRSARAFSDEWQTLGGTVVNRGQFVGSGDYSRVIKSALLVDRSEIRARQLEQLLGGKLHLQARRRQDVDMIFMLADPTQARQIKPTLAFHFGGDLPVYATSHIYSGVSDPKADRDLNGVRFTAMPWLFDNQSAEKTSVNAHAPVADIFSRLQALGTDAYRLYPRLPQLAQVPQMRLYGATGALRLLSDGRIEREQAWARFRNGSAQVLPMVAIIEAP